jgi:pimeloyl-ACP methyl ester carboxylesterase
LPSGITLRVAESGTHDAPPVVLLHGWGASLYMWRGWFAPLAAAGYRVVAVDLAGHGLSDKPSTPGLYSLAPQVALLRELLDVEQLDGAHVVAQSMGGTIALELALAHPGLVNRMALVNPAALGRVRLQPLAKLVSPAAVDVVLGRVVPRWMVARAHRLSYADGARVTARNVDEYWAPTQFPGFAPAMRRLLHEFQWSRVPVDRMADRLATLPHPPLAVLSGIDHLVRDARPYAAALRQRGIPLQVLELPRSGHAVNEEEPDLVIPRVLEHLAADG